MVLNVNKMLFMLGFIYVLKHCTLKWDTEDCCWFKFIDQPIHNIARICLWHLFSKYVRPGPLNVFPLEYLSEVMLWFDATTRSKKPTNHVKTIVSSCYARAHLWVENAKRLLKCSYIPKTFEINVFRGWIKTKSCQRALDFFETLNQTTNIAMSCVELVL